MIFWWLFVLPIAMAAPIVALDAWDSLRGVDAIDKVMPADAPAPQPSGLGALVATPHSDGAGTKKPSPSPEDIPT